MTAGTYRVLVTGSRTWTDRALIRSVLDGISRERGPGLTIVHGACPRGADLIAHYWALHCAELGVFEERHPADWTTYGKRAGFLRNAEMVEAGADELVAFIQNGSPGATHCARLAEQAGIPVRRWV